MGEDCDNCTMDCGACAPYCGDGNCDFGESCDNCTIDCGACGGGGTCGDGMCDMGEDYMNCPTDCGGGGAPFCGWWH